MPTGTGHAVPREAGPASHDPLANGFRERVRAGLDVVEVVLEEVVRRPVPTDEAAAHFRTISKITGEAGMLLRIARRALPDESSEARIVHLAEQLAPYARSREVRIAVLMRPSRAPMRALAHACLTDLGVVDARFDRLTRLAMDSSVANANERVPYRMLDAAWARHLLLGDQELDHPSISLSPIGAGVDLFAATTEDGYAFTHALVYATDFGRVPLPSRYDAAALSSTADSLCVKALDENDLDLLAELLMAPGVLRRPWSPIQVFSWRVLDAVWTAFGFVPGPGLPEGPVDEDSDAAIRRVLGTAYHTMFVSALCAATLLSLGALPPGSIPSGPHVVPAEIDCNGSACLAEWATTSAAERERLGELVLGFRFRRAAARMDVDAMTMDVRAAVVAGVSDRPIVTQALEFLERAASV